MDNFAFVEKIVKMFGGRPYMFVPAAASRRWRVLVFVALVVSTMPTSARAQVFIASRPDPGFPDPGFRVGSLFVSVGISSQTVGSSSERKPVTVNVLWSLVPSPNRRAAGLQEDLYLLWPGEVMRTKDDPKGPADPTLPQYLDERKFQVLNQGQLLLRSRHYSSLGTSAKSNPVEGVNASFVTFTRTRNAAGQAPIATFIKIPSTPILADPDSLTHISFEMNTLVTPTAASWAEEWFWGRRYLVSLSFNDVGNQTLYPLYFEHRRRVLRQAREFSLLVVNFADANQLKIEEIVPASSIRRSHPDPARENTEQVLLSLADSVGMTPQILKIQFAYFWGGVALRPIFISAFLFILGNVTGPMLLSGAKWIVRTLRARVQLGLVDDPRGRQSGVVLSRDTLARLTPGETTYHEAVRTRC